MKKETIKSPLAPERPKLNTETANILKKTNKSLLDESLKRKQINKQQYDAIFTAINDQCDGANINIGFTSVEIKGAEQIEWTVVYNPIDPIYLQG